jgi:hypothetical protein|tara:strand:+ start:2339 stop:2923 length:585 start_codon:yes stop_codon:yes gene_type:complete
MGSLSTLFPAGSSSNVLEVIQYIPDGRTFQGVTNTYTAPTLTNYQASTLSYANITGTVITYTPPLGTKYIKYEYNTKQKNVSAYSGITHYRLYVDSTQVTAAFKTFSSQYYTSYGYATFPITLTYTFDLTATSDDITNGKFSSWTGAKEIKWMFRGYNSTYDNMHLDGNTWRDGTGSSGTSTWVYPLLTLTAYS